VAYLELAALADRPLSNLRVRVEVLADDTSQTSVQTNADVTQSGRLWARARGELKLNSLAPGRYLAVAHVLSGDRELARISRPFTLARQ
jgi:hypothetical protein